MKKVRGAIKKLDDVLQFLVRESDSIFKTYIDLDMRLKKLKGTPDQLLISPAGGVLPPDAIPAQPAAIVNPSQPSASSSQPAILGKRTQPDFDK